MVHVEHTECYMHAVCAVYTLVTQMRTERGSSGDDTLLQDTIIPVEVLL